MTKMSVLTDEVQSSIDVLDAWLQARHYKQDEVGLSVGIIYDQELIWSGYYGYANKEAGIPVTSKTLYRIASISKLFTATAIVQLRDEGKLRLDDPITHYLPWFKIKTKSPKARPITIENLITHTSGLPREAAFAYWTENFEFPDLDKLKRSLPKQTAAFATNYRWKYSNLAVALAGEIVAEVSGLPYDRYVRQNILDPLDMKNTYVDMAAPGPENLAVGYNAKFPGRERDAIPFIDCKAITPAANLATNIEDLAKFGMSQFRRGPRKGKQIVEGLSLDEMHRLHWVNEAWDGGWGLGFMIWRRGDKTWFGHSGGLQGFASHLVLTDDDKFGAIAFGNSNDADPEVITNAIIDWVAPKVLALQPKPVAPKTVGLEKYAGKYRTYSMLSEVLLVDGQLMIISPLDDDPFKNASRLVPVRDHTFEVETSNGYGLAGEYVSFDMDKNGKVKRMITGYNVSYPVDDWR